MLELPTGTVTFLFTDIEGSTRLWEQHPEAMRQALLRHQALISAAIEPQGVIVKRQGEGDSVFAVFAHSADAVAAAAALQQALIAEPWPPEAPLRVRVALHTGAADQREGDYYGPTVNRCARLRAVAHGGQVLLSEATRDSVRAALPAGISLRDLGSHRLKDLQRPEHLFQLLHPSLPSDFPPLRSLEAFAHNLPAQLTSFVGREHAIAQVKRLLAATRLMTLTGSGGCGKTRLALQVAADVVQEYADGVWLVELAALADLTLVPQTVATALGVREEPNRPLAQTLLDYLHPKQALLLLDNCEHLLAACAQLADHLLRGCPRLRILASSREALGIMGEQIYGVPSLSLPDPKRLPPLERLHEFEGVQLFADRAGLVQSTFTLTEANATAVIQVCRRLDGIPLAIELAAARIRALSVEEIAARLDDRFSLLTGGSRTALPRQQTLRALIDWSYGLLSEPERTLLRRLSVFAEGATLQAAEAVCARDPIAEWEVLDLLTALVDKSLIIYEESPPASGLRAHAPASPPHKLGASGGCGGARYRLLETVRQYARDRLLEAGEGQAVRGQHLDFFLELAERAEPGLAGASQEEWLRRLESEHDNLRTAGEWALESSPEAALRLAGSLCQFWCHAGYFAEGRERVAAVLERAGPWRQSVAGIKALNAAGSLAWGQGKLRVAISRYEEGLAIARQLGDSKVIASSLDYLGLAVCNLRDAAAARRLHEEALALRQELKDQPGIASSLDHLGEVALQQGDHPGAHLLYQESLAIAQQLGDARLVANSLMSLGRVVLAQGDYEVARSLSGESLAIRRELGDQRGIAQSLSQLAEVAYEQGDYEAARSLCAESLAITRGLAARGDIAESLGRLGKVMREQGDYGSARPVYEESLALWRELGAGGRICGSLYDLAFTAYLHGDYTTARLLYAENLTLHREALRSGDLSPWWEMAYRRGAADCLDGIADISAHQGRMEQAARLHGAAEAMRGTLGVVVAPPHPAIVERNAAALRGMLRAEADAAARAEGRAMTLQQAIEYALKSR